jgi:hypothetical protein
VSGCWLPADLVEYARRRGLERHRVARANGQQHADRWQPDLATQQRVDVNAAIAECFVAFVTGRKWAGDRLRPDRPGECDVEPDIAVRWTDHVDGGLLVKARDPVDQRGALVVGAGWPDLRIAGWYPFALAKLPEFWRDNIRQPAFIVPQKLLLPIADLAVDA